jgi:NAD(P)-dependent dehydrogenase (short-subunit alcohol dehydrogenase family)
MPSERDEENRSEGEAEPRVAWVAEGDAPWGRAVALALAARGVRVLVTGKHERTIAECVGEIAHAGGKARHFVGDAATDAGARACGDAVVARFGSVGFVVAGPATAECVTNWARSRPSVRVVSVERVDEEAAAVSTVLRQLEQAAGQSEQR